MTSVTTRRALSPVSSPSEEENAAIARLYDVTSADTEALHASETTAASSSASPAAASPPAETPVEAPANARRGGVGPRMLASNGGLSTAMLASRLDALLTPVSEARRGVVEAFSHAMNPVSDLGEVRRGEGVLRLDDRGPMVEEMQRLLTAREYGVATTGVFGPTTQETLKRFQREHGLEPRGDLDQVTLRLLEEAPTFEDVRARKSVIQPGQHGPSVAALQERLGGFGYPVVQSGTYDAATQTAVKAYQRDHQIQQTAKVGPTTLAALDKGPGADDVRARGAVLQLGTKGPGVAHVQQRLGRHGFPVAATGELGPMTQSLVLAFQKSRGLEQTGKVGPTTLGFLDQSPPLAVVRQGGSLLERGERGESVSQVQSMLDRVGYPLAADGAFGPGTEKVIRTFQRDHDLQQNGKMGPSTLAALDFDVRHNVRFAEAWENGQRLAPVRVRDINGYAVEVRTAAAFETMQAAAAKDGVNLAVFSGFRTYERQAELRRGWEQGLPGYNGANAPGYSDHQNGVALDIDNSSYSTVTWLARNAERFGFVAPYFTRSTPVRDQENWHWEYRPSRVGQYDYAI